jgi:hypothetical protein
MPNVSVGYFYHFLSVQKVITLSSLHCTFLPVKSGLLDVDDEWFIWIDRLVEEDGH